MQSIHSAAVKGCIKVLILSLCMGSPLPQALAWEPAVGQIIDDQGGALVKVVNPVKRLTGTGVAFLHEDEVYILTSRHVAEGVTNLLIGTIHDTNRKARITLHAKLHAVAITEDAAFYRVYEEIDGEPFSSSAMKEGRYGLFRPIDQLLAKEGRTTAPLSRGKRVGLLGLPDMSGWILTWTEGVVASIRIEQGDSMVYASRLYWTTAPIGEGGSGSLAVDQQGRFAGIGLSGHYTANSPISLSGILPANLIIRAFHDPEHHVKDWDDLQMGDWTEIRCCPLSLTFAGCRRLFLSAIFSTMVERHPTVRTR
ncbi:MAG: serine protease [Xanthomonadales bacterium]|nr:serine protease [Xanthomonadales bacterium]